MCKRAFRGHSKNTSHSSGPDGDGGAGGVGTVSLNETWGERGFFKVPRDIFSKIFLYFGLTKVFLEKQNVTGGGRSAQVPPNDTWGRGYLK
jgi:hypothetical protein